jgi:hypothetical protein
MLKKGLLIFSFVLIFTAVVGLYFTFMDDNKDETTDETVDVIEINTAATLKKKVDFSHVEIPPLPFADNPDPEECGIPQPWGSNNNIAYLSGEFEGQLIQSTVYLYDSHGRNAIVAAAKHGTEVEVVLFQANPVLNYYFVKIPGAPQAAREGWVPAPFLSFEPVEVGEA